MTLESNEHTKKINIIVILQKWAYYPWSYVREASCPFPTFLPAPSNTHKSILSFRLSNWAFYVGVLTNMY